MTASWAKSRSPSHPNHPIDSVRANSAFRCTGTRSPSRRQISDCPVPAAWELQTDVHRVGKGMPQLTPRDRGILRVLPGPQLRDAVGALPGKSEPLFPFPKLGYAKLFPPHAGEDNYLPARSDSSCLLCALPPDFSFTGRCGSSLLSHKSENTLPPP